MNKSIILILALIGMALSSDPELHYKELNKTAIVGNVTKGIYELREYEEFSIATVKNVERDHAFHVLENYTGRFNYSGGALNKEN